MTDRIKGYEMIFWDFDGVIKESVEVKTKAFQKIFSVFGADVLEKVTTHHIENGGMSRFDKIPIYLNWAGIESTPDTIENYCSKFAEIVEDDVVNCDWVPGAERLFKAGKGLAAYNVLVTATPQDEILRILDRLSIRQFFSNIFGSPTPKDVGIGLSLDLYKISPDNALMIGDSKADYAAAKKCGTNFLLRKTPENLVSMPDYQGLWVNNFEEYDQKA